MPKVETGSIPRFPERRLIAPLAASLHRLASRAQHGLGAYRQETIDSIHYLPRNVHTLFGDRPESFRYRVFEAAVIAATTAATVIAVGGRLPH